MTLLIIHPEISVRNSYLLEKVNSLMEKKYSQLSQLYTNPDIHIIEQPEHVNIKLEEVKKLQKEMLYKPFDSPAQIGIIFHSQNLTIEAQNALLKTLEEQPDSTYFILLVNNEKSLLPTIASRAIKHFVKNVSTTEVAEATEIERPEILDLDLTAQFSLIEKSVESEKEEKGTINKILKSMLIYYQAELQNGIVTGDKEKTDQIGKIIESIQTAEMRINANVNKRLLLENMILQINRLGGKY